MADRGRFPAKRRKTWEDMPALVTVFTASTTQLGGGLPFEQAGSTVLRMMGEYTIHVSSAPVALDRARIGIGIGVVSSDAFALGSTAVPDPLGELEYPWLYWAEHALAFSDADTNQSGAAGSVRKAFDVKSQRKVGARQTLAGIFQYSDVNGTPPLTLMFGQVRVLLALP